MNGIDFRGSFAAGVPKLLQPVIKNNYILKRSGYVQTWNMTTL